MAVTKTPKAVITGSPASATYQVVPEELRILLDEMRVETAAALDAQNRLAAAACATTAHITLAGEQTIDGVLTSTSRVLVKNQSGGGANGVYISGAGTWARAADADTSAEIALAYVHVIGGTANGGKNFQVVNSPIIGTDAVVWAEVASAADVVALAATLGDLALQDTATAAQISDASAAGRAVLVAADAAAQRTALGLGSVDNTSDLSKPVSTAQQTALNLKAPLASPEFTGTPTGITKTHVGLANVDNTSDVSKPVSTAQAAALALKADASALTSGLATKADDAATTSALALKADSTALVSGLAAKADVSTMATALAGKLDISAKASLDEAIAGLNTTKWVSAEGVRAALEARDNENDQTLMAELEPTFVHQAVSPGLTPLRYCAQLEGSASQTVGLEYPSNTVASVDGNSVRIYGESTVAMRDVIVLAERQRKYEVRWRGRRAINTDDPAGDAVQFGIAWLDSAFSTADITTAETIIQNYTALVTSSGWVQYSAIIAGSSLTGVNHYSTEAAYARPFVRQFGSGDAPALDIEVLTSNDVSYSEVVSDVALDTINRVTALEQRRPLLLTGVAVASDMNALLTDGTGYVSNPVNGPIGAASMIGYRVERIDGSTVMQTAWDAAGTDNAKYWRVRVGAGFGSWQRVASESYVDQVVAALANSVAPWVPVVGDFLPEITFQTPGTGTVAYGTRACEWTYASKRFSFEGMVVFTPTKGTATGQVYLGGFPSAYRPAIFTGSTGIVPINLVGVTAYPSETGSTGAYGEARWDALDRVTLALRRLNGSPARHNRRFLSVATDLTDGVEVTLAFSGSWAVA